MSSILKGIQISKIPKSFFKSSRFDSTLLKDLPVREFPAFVKANMGQNGYHRICRFFEGNFPAPFFVRQTKSIVALVAIGFIPSFFNALVRWQFNFQKYNTARNLLITDEQWEELTESQKHHFKVYLITHLIWPDAQPPHLPPPVEFVPSHWKDDPNAPINRAAPKRDAHH
eukprot:CAMPEP_0117447902 /NCGR_PEP_ID=MMETSP0759-20121206/7116_1 /TAXON_ID=63605 /ORGANISM="Percolomonas cosmopolitus, Strain WS" /LENGTH=170 /DNA_ID=CAMNT_0005240255 /DNA_START=709 /DNA_END=1221 /DNA_ORIENTATION=+